MFQLQELSLDTESDWTGLGWGVWYIPRVVGCLLIGMHDWEIIARGRVGTIVGLSVMG